MERCHVESISIFGFAEANPSNGPQIYAGFDQGIFRPDEEREWYEKEELQRHIRGKPTKAKTGLSKNQADAAVSASSFHSVVLTCDEKRGPIASAKVFGGAVIYLSDELLAVQPLAKTILEVADRMNRTAKR